MLFLLCHYGSGAAVLIAGTWWSLRSLTLYRVHSLCLIYPLGEDSFTRSISSFLNRYPSSRPLSIATYSKTSISYRSLPADQPRSGLLPITCISKTSHSPLWYTILLSTCSQPMQLSSNTVLARPVQLTSLDLTTRSPKTIKRKQRGKREYVRSGTKYKQRKDGRGVLERDWRDRRPDSKGGIIRHAPESKSGRRTARNENKEGRVVEQ